MEVYIKGFISLLAVIFLVVLAGKVRKKYEKSWTGRLYLFSALNIGLYLLINFLSLFPLGPLADHQLFIIRLTMVTCTFFGPALLLMAFTFPDRRLGIGKWTLAMVGLVTLTVVGLNFSPMIFEGLRFINGMPVPEFGRLFSVWPIYTAVFYGASFMVFIRHYLSAPLSHRDAYLFVAIGMTFSAMLEALSTFLSISWFRTSLTVFIGPFVWLIYPTVLAWVLLNDNDIKENEKTDVDNRP